MSDPTPDRPSLIVDGKIYGGWLELRATRGLERCAADFDIGLTERWPGRSITWPLGPFTAIELRLGDDPIIVGHVDVWAPSLEAATTTLRISGRSKTADLIDCSPTVGTGEFRASSLEAIARAFAEPYGIAVENRAGVTAPIPLAAYKRSETCFSILDKLARQAGVMLSDGPAGQLLITRGPAVDAAPVAKLVEGVNIRAAQLKVDVSKRFSLYEARTQAPVAAAVSLNPVGDRPLIAGLGDGDQGSSRRVQQAATRAVTDASGGATDPDVTRLRLMVLDAESAGNGVSAQARAVWQCAVNAGQSIRLSVTVGGWRRPDKMLWAPGDMVAVQLPTLRLERSLVVVQVTWTLDGGGQRTTLDLAPPEGFLPEPLPPAGAAAGAPARLNSIAATAPIDLARPPGGAGGSMQGPNQ